MTIRIEETDIASIAYDEATGLLGYTTASGFFRTVDLATGERVETYNLGSALGGFAFSDDGTAWIANVEFAAYWTDEDRDGLIHRLDRGEPAVDNVTFDMDQGNSSATDVAIASNGLGLVTVTDQWTPLYVLDTGLGTVTQFDTGEYASYYSPRVTLSDQGRYVLIQEVGISNNPAHLWDSLTNEIVAYADSYALDDLGYYGLGVGGENASVSEAAGLVVLGDLVVLDMDLRPVAALGNVAGERDGGYWDGWEAHAFSSDGAILYAVDGERGLMVAIDTATMDLADAFAVATGAGVADDGYGREDGDVVRDMAVIDDATFVFQLDDALLVDTLASLAAPDATGTANDDALVGTRRDDRLIGLGGNDFLTGADGADLIEGGIGADELHGGRGADTLRGGAGNDTLDGGGGADVFAITRGDAGRDDVLGFDASEDAFDLVGLPGVSDLNDIAALRVGNDLTLTFDDATSVRLVGFAGRASDISFVFSPRANVGQGTEKGEVMEGTSGDDFMEGLGGDDTLMGMDGADMIFGGAGHDVLYGDSPN